MADGEWRAQLPEELRSNEAFQPHAAIGDFAKAHLGLLDEKSNLTKTVEGHVGKIQELEGKMGNMIPKLPDNATDEERQIYWHELGKPETPDEYEVPVPEGATEANKAMETWFRKTAHAANLSKDQAKFMGAEWNKLVALMSKEEHAAIDTARKESETKLKTELGGEERYTAATALADRLWKASTNQDFTTFLKENGMIKNPYPIIKVIIDLAKRTGEDLSPLGMPRKAEGDGKGMNYSKSPAPPSNQ